MFLRFVLGKNLWKRLSLIFDKNAKLANRNGDHLTKNSSLIFTFIEPEKKKTRHEGVDQIIHSVPASKYQFS